MTTPHPSKAWLIGAGALTPILSVVCRVKEQARAAYVQRTAGTDGFAYSPWMKIPGESNEISALVRAGTPTSPGGVLLDPAALELLAAAVAEPGSHAIARIVPRDIGVTIATNADEVCPSLPSIYVSGRTVLGDATPWIARILESTIDCFVPIRHRRDGRPVKRGFSTPDCYGAVFLTFEERPLGSDLAVEQMGIDMAHEVAHHVLHAYQFADPILRGDLRTPVYSGVRKEYRPAIMAVHASVALAFMIAFCDSRIASRRAAGSTAQWLVTTLNSYRSEQQRALTDLADRCELTPLGAQLMAEMRAQLAMN